MEKAIPTSSDHLTESQQAMKAIYYECVREIQELGKKTNTNAPNLPEGGYDKRMLSTKGSSHGIDKPG